jgi:hypothetical protein
VKKLALILSAFCYLQGLLAQAPDTTLSNDKNIRNKVLSDIQDNLDKKTQNIDQTLAKLDNKVDSLDMEIAASRDARDKADKLLLKEKDHDPSLEVLHDMVTVTGNITSATPIAGPVFRAFFIGINSYIAL